MATDRQLEIYAALDGSVQTGYDRADLPMVHAIIRVLPGQKFHPSTHWPCEVCAQPAHNFTMADFIAQWESAVQRYRARYDGE